MECQETNPGGPWNPLILPSPFSSTPPPKYLTALACSFSGVRAWRREATLAQSCPRTGFPALLFAREPSLPPPHKKCGFSIFTKAASLREVKCSSIKVKVKVPLDNCCPVVSDSRRRRSSRSSSHRASVLSEDNLPWSHGQCDLDTERCYLPTKVVPIYLLAFACFRTARLAGAGTSDGNSLRHVDSIL